MRFRDYYETLGVARGASQDDIKRAYRRLARKYHPDVSKESDAEARFKEVGEAYEVLKDPEKRAAYDRFGKDWKHGQEFRPPPGWERRFDFGGGGFSGDSGFSDFFESLFGRGGFAGARGPMRARGGDQSATIEIPLEDAYRGATRNITVGGRTLSVRIPKGVTEGQRIRLGGQGGAGAGGGLAGDLYLTVAHAAHPLFRAEGRDVYLKLPVAPWEAALGATVAVPTLGGKVDLKIPPGSRAGRSLRLKGRGLPGRPNGDQYVTLEVVAPPADSPEAESLYRKMAETMPFDPRPDFPR
ncbi:MAG: DnaJ domain-containing protein [Chromatiales bacterium]|nr:DnaJ domain-containing protein [Chromatiales bacterium]